MKKEQNFRGPLQHLKDHPEKVKGLVNSFRDTERASVERIVNFYLDRKYKREELEYHRLVQASREIKKLGTKSSNMPEQKNDPCIYLQLVKDPIHGFIDNEIEYWGFYTNARAMLPEFVVIPPQGGISFFFIPGLKKGQYVIWTDVYTWPDFQHERFKTACVADPASSVTESTPVVKYISAYPATTMLGGIDVLWSVKETADHLFFHIKNISEEDIACFGVGLIGCY